MQISRRFLDQRQGIMNPSREAKVTGNSYKTAGKFMGLEKIRCGG